MPVKTTSTQNIPFLIKNTPPDLTGITLAENIQDMISYDLYPLDEPLKVTYQLGSTEELIAFRIVFRNLTTNAILRISQKQNKKTLLLLEDNDSIIDNAIDLTLNPAETRSLRIFFNNQQLDSFLEKNILENLELVVTYTATEGQLVQRNLLEVLPRKTIEEKLEEESTVITVEEQIQLEG